MYRGYFITGEGKELVAIKTCKRKCEVLSGKVLIYSAYDNYSNTGAAEANWCGRIVVHGFYKEGKAR